eukprot:6196969-Pleurochrysis_carterae.AAC.1
MESSRNPPQTKSGVMWPSSVLKKLVTHWRYLISFYPTFAIPGVTAAGLAQQEARKAKVDVKRAKRAARASERARIDARPLAEHYSDLKLMG